MRRTVATLLVVASPLLVAVPVGAADGPVPGRIAAVPEAPAAAVPAPPVAVAPPAVTAPAAPALPAAAAVERATAAAAPVRPVTRTVHHATPRLRDLDDAAYATRLQADLCQARTIFCGLDHSGHYPAH